MKPENPFPNAKPLEVRTNTAWVGWFCLLIFLPCAFFSWNHPTGGPSVASIFIFFAVLGVYLIFGEAVLRVDEEKIETKSVFATNSLLWSQVASVKMDEDELSLLFESVFTKSQNPKNLVFSGPQNWKKAGKIEMMLLLETQCHKRKIPFHKNARIAGIHKRPFSGAS